MTLSASGRKPAEDDEPAIDYLTDDPVYARIGIDVPFEIYGSNLSKNMKLCAVDENGGEVHDVNLAVDMSSTNTKRHLYVIVSAGDEVPLDKRGKDLAVAVKRNDGSIGVLGGTLIVV